MRKRITVGLSSKPWVKLPVQHSGPWLGLSFWARTIGSELLRYFGTERRLEGVTLAEFPAVACRMMAVDARLRKHVRDRLAEIIDAGLIVESEGDLLMMHTDTDIRRGLVPRWDVFERDEWQCTYCKTPLTFDTGCIDHIMPRSRGGSDAVHNLTSACVPCNQSKGSKTLAEWRGRDDAGEP